jgi:bla regulator protein BlaR1
MNIVLAVVDAVLNTLWQTAVIAAVVWLFLRSMPRINAATRCTLWWATLGAVLLLPLEPRVLPPVRHPSEAMRTTGPRPMAIDLHDPISEQELVRVSSGPTAIWPWVAFCVWAAVLLCRLVQISRSYFYLRGVKQRAEAATVSLPKIRRDAAVLVSREIASPLAAGFLHPAIVLPQFMLSELTEAEQEHVVLHEAAHLAGYDDWTNLALRIAGGAMALHPVAIWILRQIEREREIACDDWVVARTGAARPYAKSLVRLMELRQARNGPVLAVGIFGTRSRIGRRIEHLLRAGRTFSGRASRGGVLASVAGLAILMFGGSLAPRWIAFAQQSTPDWQIKAGGTMAFEVASVKPDTGAFRPPAFPLDEGNSYAATGGRFFATFPLISYIRFAYKVRPAPDQLQALLARVPKWVGSERFAVEARAPQSNPTKDQIRMMMQSLLAERFHLRLHFETETVPAFALLLAKPGKWGPQLRPHAEGPPCDTPASDKIFPGRCDTYMAERQVNGTLRAGSRQTTLDRLAGAIPTFGSVSRPVVDRTGLSGDFDFTLEWMPESTSAAPPKADEAPGPTFLEALKEQLGLKLEATKATVEVPVIDHVERPSEN